jgi:hypothetical protein
MAVTFTPNIGLAKPTEAELGANWINGTHLEAANNLIIIDKMDINELTWTPAFIGPTTNPNSGVGAVYAEYTDVQGFICGTFTFNMTDPGVAAGTGAGGYGISLPTLVDTAYHTVGTTLNDIPGTASVIGEGYITDASSIANSGTVAVDIIAIGGVHYARLITEAYPGKTVHQFGPNNPFVLATGDQFSANFLYKKA